MSDSRSFFKSRQLVRFHPWLSHIDYVKKPPFRRLQYLHVQGSNSKNQMAINRYLCCHVLQKYHGTSGKITPEISEMFRLIPGFYGFSGRLEATLLGLQPRSWTFTRVFHDVQTWWVKLHEKLTIFPVWEWWKHGKAIEK